MKANPIAYSPIVAFQHGFRTTNERYEAVLREYHKGHAPGAMVRADEPGAEDFFCLGHTVMLGTTVRQAGMPFDAQAVGACACDLLQEIAAGTLTLVCTPEEEWRIGLIDAKTANDPQYRRVNRITRSLQHIAAREILRLLTKDK